MKSIEMLRGSYFWKEFGCRNDSSTLVGRMKSKCQACHEEEGTEKHRLYHCPGWYKIRREIPEAFSKWEQKARI